MKKEIWYSLIMVSILGGALVVALMDVPTGTSFRYEIKTFDSYEDLRSHIQSRYMSCYLPSYYMPSAKPYAGKTSLENALDGGCNDFSKTNIQVEGVDEADIVKTDGTYIYIIANNCLYIIFAYPASDAEILSKIEFSENLYLRELYIDNDKVIVIAESWRMIDLYNDSKEKSSDYIITYPISIPSTTIRIYDVSDRKNPELIKDVSIDGYYFDSRMIDGKVYLVSVEESYYIFPTDSIINIPEIRIDDSVYKIPAEEIYYPDIPNTNADSLTHIVAIDINDGTFDEKSFLIDYSQNMYVSKDSIYITTIKYPVRPLLVSPYFSEDHTVVHKISIKEGKISYVAQGEIPGRVLNRFSMDEFDGFFRIATTTGSVWQGNSKNNIYVLDENLKVVSKLEGLAPGERIYSVRFMEEKAFLVTFKKVDPFFVVDLSDPYNPKVLGELKIPGYSTYLHPYDENHIIGIGKDTVEALDEEKEMRNLDFAWYQGIKISLFDVTDFEHPKEIAKVVIGDRGSDSEALYNHKAFLFDRDKELLVIPVRVYEIDDSTKNSMDNYTGSLYGEFSFQGAYVYRVTIDGGFQLLGKVTHGSDYDSAITRSLYINNVLYTISQKMIKMNDLETMKEIGSITLQ